MNDISNEITDLIIDHLVRVAPALAPYATVSPNWRMAVERRLFAKIKINSDELGRFEHVFTTSRWRRALLRKLRYDALLPTYGAQVRVPESRDDHLANVSALSGAVRALFTALHKWEKPEAGHGLELTLDIYSPMDYGHRPLGAGYGIGPARRAGKYLKLDLEDDRGGLPSVPLITKFALSHDSGRPVIPSVPMQLLSAMPNVESTEIELLAPPMIKPYLRRHHRLLLANSLNNVDLSRLRRLNFHYETSGTPFNHSFKCWDALGDSPDKLNLALRRLSQESPLLTEVKISGLTISPELFGNDTTWPSLQRLDITADLVAPSGEWYYTGEPEGAELDDEGRRMISRLETLTGDELEDPVPEDFDYTETRSQAWVDTEEEMLKGERPSYEWRTRPDPRTFDSLVRAMTDTATERMPRLRRLGFRMGMDMSEPIGVTIECLEAGERSIDPPDLKEEADEEMRVRRWKVWTGVAATWDVPEQVVGAWERWVGDEGKVVVGSWPSF
ncbi:hypothetical protein GGR57DRAFT_495097 [Xylariaceae sp. FL1272]|nr:hypothetical protein GGR57DRAFT_495097 [Xylariaceae sp. FL1272]